ncbi:MAG: hypothetical protein U0625_01355 [Phycisphaerales bacterium]
MLARALGITMATLATSIALAQAPGGSGGGAPPAGQEKGTPPAQPPARVDPLAGISKDDQAKYREAVAHGLKQRDLSIAMRAALKKMISNRPPKEEDVKAYEAALKALDRQSAATAEMMSADKWTDADRAKMGDIIAKIVGS